MRYFPLVAIALPLALLSCGQTPPATQSSSPATPSPVVTTQSPGTFVVNGKTLAPAGEPCELPQAIADSELFSRILTVPIGSSPEETQEQISKPPDQPFLTYQDPSFGTLIWTDNYNFIVVEMRMEFKDRKLTERFIMMSENVGQDNEKNCSWRSRD
ncbi:MULTISPECIES: hypothetical protein [Trichocoleus]|uniref:Lipoprotein n=1 Tax=Trichocoleus desertorum GB2-A4 TaxID=2933944 RepID=A0ABV0JEV9_9CYAN|nr:hypothetical protein [Trichocoleus sp. FACHB-46]MBD1864263.1 hypothetical protein [Trichocoleus sp. FACHB-46]